VLSQADELFYGGQAGGGKTDLLLGLAAELHLNSLILRREYKQMTGADGIIERSREIIGDKGRYNGQEHLWREVDGKRSIEFGGLPYEATKNNYQGRAHDLKAFDELTEFTKGQYEFIIRWNRSTVQDQRCRVVSTGNPPTHQEGRWVIDYWGPWLDDKHPSPALPGELRWYVVVNGESKAVDGPEPVRHHGEKLLPRSRTFIPAALDDNPYLGEAYRSNLQGAPEPLRSQLLLGDFTAGITDDAWQVIPTEWVKAAQGKWDSGGWKGRRLDQIGIDVARGGDDYTAYAFRFDTWIGVEKVSGKMTTKGKHVLQHLRRILIERFPGVEIGPHTEVNVDVIGIGSSAFDAIYEDEGVARVNAVNASSATKRTNRNGQLQMRNVRSFYHWNMRESLEPGAGDELAIEDSPTVLADLTAPRYDMLTTGVAIEDKEKIKKRLGRSPDEGEAIMLACYKVRRGVGFG
jgi:hypothetical protein